MGLWQKFKNWITGKSTRQTSSPRRSSGTSYRSVGSRYRSSGSNRDYGSNYTQRGRVSNVNRVQIEQERKRKEREQLRKKAFAVRKGEYKSIVEKNNEPKKDTTSNASSSGLKSTKGELRRKLLSRTTLETHNDRKKSTPISKTKGITSEERKKVRRDVVKYNPKAAGAIGGFASGITFGASDLLASRDAKNDPNSGAAHYKKYRNKKAELAGEIAGSLVSFGGAGKAAERTVAKGLSTKGGKKAVTKLAESKLVRRSAEKAVKKAIKKGTIKEGSEALVKEIAKDKASRLARNIGENIAVDTTAGALYDLNKASARHKIGSKEWKKEMRDNALINVGAAGVGVGLGNVKRNKTVINEALERMTKKDVAKSGLDNIVRRNSIGQARGNKRVSPRIGENIEDRIARVDAGKTTKKTSGKSVALQELDTRGEANLGQYGRVTKGNDGKYSLHYGGGNGSEEITKTQAESYIKDAEKRLVDDEVRASKIAPPPARRKLTGYSIRRRNEGRPLDELRGESWLGQYGHITKNEDGTFNLFRNGVGDRKMSKAERDDYIDWAQKRLADDEARTRKTRVSALNDREKARVSEIDARVNKLDAESRADAKAYRDGRYSDKGYTERQAARGKEIGDLTREKTRILDKEPDVEIKSTDDVMVGYTSTGHKRKINSAKKQAKALLASGDEQGARKAVKDAVDDIVANTKVVEDLDGDIKDIKELIRKTPLKLSSKQKIDAGYMSGSYNELRKQNYGNLRLTKEGADVDEFWQELNERYGNLFPEDIDNPSEQLEYLSNFMRQKGSAYDVIDDEAANLKKELEDSIWNELNGRTTKAKAEAKTADEIADELIAEPSGQYRNKATEAVEDTTPFNAVDDTAEGIRPDTPLDSARARAQEMARGEGASRTPMPDFDDIEESADELPWGVRKVRESLESATGRKVNKGDKAPSTKEVYDAYKDYHISQGKEGVRRKQSRAAASQINAMSTEEEKALREKLVQKGEGDYEVIFTHELFDQITNEFKEDGAHWVDRIIDASEDVNKVGAGEIPQMQARCQYLMSVLNPSSDNTSEQAYSAAFKLAKDLASKSGQTLNMRRNFVKLTKAGKIESTVDDLVNILDGAIGFNRKHRKQMPKGKYDRINYIKGVLMSDPEIEKAVTKVADAKNEDAVSEAYTELLLAFNKKNPKSGYDVVQEARYLFMLGNPKTHIRNMFGSGFFAPMRQVSNAIRGSIEDSVAKAANARYGTDMKIDVKHGGISLSAAKEAMTNNPTTEAGKAAKEALERRASDFLGSAKYGTQQYKGRSKTLVGKGLDALSDFNSNMLVKEDDFFKRLAFKENYIKSYNRYVKDGKPITDKVKRAIEADAIQEAQIATFNEYNSFANALQKFTKSAGDANASAGKRWLARGVNALMPFEKVPANLGKQSINYSPVGIARGFYNIKRAAMQNDSALLNQAIDQLASGVTGTGVFALGMLLGKTTDMFTTNAGKDDPAAKFKKGQGVQNYAITFKDPITKETHSYTLDWLVPMSATFFAGVEASNELKEGGNGLAAFADWATVTSRLAEPVMETSMLSGLHSMLETMRGGYNGDDELGSLQILFRETAQSYLNSLTPTLMGQIARTAYKSDKQVTGADDWEYFRNSLKSKTGLAADNALTRKLGIETLGADTDLYGNVKNRKENASDYAVSALKNLLSPSNIQKVDLSEVDKEKIAEYERRVKAGEDPNNLSYLFPKKQYNKTFAVGDENINMSNKELSLYNRAKTKGGAEGMRFVLENVMFNRYEENSRGDKVLADGYTKEQKANLISQFRGKSLREVEEWLYKQPQFKKATEAEKRKAIKGLWNIYSEGKAVGARRVGEQAVYKAQGKQVSEYNFKNELSEKKQKALLPYVESGVLTYAEAVDFARNAGKTYYYENDDGGTAQTYFNKKQMIEYLVKKGYSYEKAEALFNSFKAGNAKPYSGNNLYSGRRRRSYRRRGYRRRGRGSGGSGGSGIKIKESAFKAKSVKLGSILPPSPKSTSSSKSKIAPPKIKVTPPKAKKYEI